MTTRQAWARWAPVWVVAALLAAPGCSSKPEASEGNTGQAAEKGVSVAPSSSQAEPPKELTLDPGGGVTMKLVLIGPGKFMMGEGEGRHQVTLSTPFYLGVTEVTQAQYQAIMGKNPSHFKGTANPVDNVSWDDATEFCKKLFEKTRQAVRLPTEAEWEYACRAGSTTKFCFGDDYEALGDYAWYSANSDKRTHPVGQKKPNSWGLYDTYGNVWEWCSDWYAAYTIEQAADPTGPAAGSAHVLRGGGWYFDSLICCSASRGKCIPDGRFSYFGLRVAAAVGPGLQ